MSRMKNLTIIEQEMFRFLRNSFKFTNRQLKPEFEQVLQKVKHLEGNRFETRSLAYLDIISWLESKVAGRPMQEIVYNKYMKSKRKIRTGNNRDLLQQNTADPIAAH